MSNFAGLAAYYSEFRPGIPPKVAQVLADAVAGEPHRTLLDLGTGTGQVIQALHKPFVDIIGADPDIEMLELAEKNCQPFASPGRIIRFFGASAESFAAPDGWRASLVTICRAFHWMEQSRVLASLEPIVHSGGAVAIFGDSSFWEASSEWKKGVRAVIQEFLGERRRAGGGVFSHHNRPYSEILAESPFHEVEEVTVPVRRTWTADSILGYLYSTSFAAPPLFGDRLSSFEARIREVLAQHSSSDTYEEDNEFLIRLGRRSS
ncbi:class I SAM-dependent methyltransferase [Parafrankia discariae]|uniref:class I SAM-dependent methyltransferase n=1 Tax=Parafrankia discariae TaxID=365528 RepID=UPI000370E08A|nr:class I SAM-dependent methyltransferase [Parafrankia discariae]